MVFLVKKYTKSVRTLEEEYGDELVSVVGEKESEVKKRVSESKYSLARLFSRVEIGEKKDGKMSKREFGYFLKHFSEGMSYREVEYLFRKIDNDGSGYVEKEEFMKWLGVESEEVERMRKELSEFGEKEKNEKVRAVAERVNK